MKMIHVLDLIGDGEEHEDTWLPFCELVNDSQCLDRSGLIECRNCPLEIRPANVSALANATD